MSHTTLQTTSRSDWTSMAKFLGSILLCHKHRHTIYCNKIFKLLHIIIIM